MLTLDQPTYDALTKLSDCSGIAMSQWASAMLRQAAPQLHALADAFTVAQTNPREAGRIMEQAVLDTHVMLAQQSIELAPRKRLRKRRADKTKGQSS